MARIDKHIPRQSLMPLRASVIMAAFFVFALLQGVQSVHAESAAPLNAPNPPHSFFSLALDKISAAVSRFRGALTGKTQSQRAIEGLAARKSVLTSVLEYLIDETEEAQQALIDLPIDQKEKDIMAHVLEEDHAWFSGMADGISDARAISQLQTIADDIAQYRDQRHAILTRTISELSVAYRQRALVETARVRARHIENDLASLDEQSRPTTELRVSLAGALEKIGKSSDLVSQTIVLLSEIHSPYEENKYRTNIEESHQLLSQSSALLREAYKIFISMTDTLK